MFLPQDVTILARSIDGAFIHIFPLTADPRGSAPEKPKRGETLALGKL